MNEPHSYDATGTASINSATLRILKKGVRRGQRHSGGDA